VSSDKWLYSSRARCTSTKSKRLRWSNIFSSANKNYSSCLISGSRRKRMNTHKWKQCITSSYKALTKQSKSISKKKYHSHSSRRSTRQKDGLQNYSRQPTAIIKTSPRRRYQTTMKASWKYSHKYSLNQMNSSKLSMSYYWSEFV
jgi:hypothetical protein